MHNHTPEELLAYYTNFHKDANIPEQHIAYLRHMRDALNISPKVIYDIGAGVLHWYKNAREIWPDAQIIAFEAVREFEPFYKQYGVQYHIGVFSDLADRELTFYNHPVCFSGNSYYKENPQHSAAASHLYPESAGEQRTSTTIDVVAAAHGIPAPDLIKIDVQGAELDILLGMPDTLRSVQHIIVEMQHIQYNIGAKLVADTIPLIEAMGFKLVHQAATPDFCGNGPDADYHFSR
jgi:FkbM family methyltransferase